MQQYSVGSQVIGQSSCSLDSTGRNKDLMLYHDKDAFWEMCTEGPYGVCVWCVCVYVLSGCVMCIQVLRFISIWTLYHIKM